MTFLQPTILCGLLITLFACGADSGSSSAVKDKTDQAGETDQADDNEDDGSDDSNAKDNDDDSAKPSPKDERGSARGTKDAGGSSSGSKDGGATKSDAGTSDGVNARQDAGAPNFLPPVPDAGSTIAPASDTETEPDAADPNGPCADLYLFCFDIFDMFIFNPSDCFTCNGGEGCQGCAIPFAY